MSQYWDTDPFLNVLWLLCDLDPFTSEPGGALTSCPLGARVVSMLPGSFSVKAGNQTQ